MGDCQISSQLAVCNETWIVGLSYLTWSIEDGLNTLERWTSRRSKMSQHWKDYRHMFFSSNFDSLASDGVWPGADTASRFRNAKQLIALDAPFKWYNAHFNNVSDSKVPVIAEEPPLNTEMTAMTVWTLRFERLYNFDYWISCKFRYNEALCSHQYT